MNPLQPTPALLVKLGSLVVHLEERASPNGHYLDELAIESIQKDEELRAWFQAMRGLALLPVKR